MFNRFFNKEGPDFWNEYSMHFRNKPVQDLDKVRFVIFDTETTGLNVVNDRVLSIGAIGVKKNAMMVSDSFEIYLEQEIFDAKSVEIHGILKGGKIVKQTEKEAIMSFLGYIENAVLVAHHAAFDIAMINAGLKRMGLPKLKNKVLDTGILFKKAHFCDDKMKHFSLDYLSTLFKLKNHDRHTAAGDAFLTGMIFIKIVSSLRKIRKITLKDLFFNSNRRGLL